METKEEKSKKLIEDFANLVNNYNFDSNAMISAFSREHRTLQQSMFRAILQLIAFISGPDYQTDGRNEGSKTIAKKLIEGFAEIKKKEEIEVLRSLGYSPEMAEEKAEKFRIQIIADPKSFLHLSFV